MSGSPAASDDLRAASDDLRAAVIGLGVAGGWAVQALSALGGVACVAGVDPRGAAAPGASVLEAPIHRQIPELGAHGRLDLVVVCSGTPTHAEVALAALELAPRWLWVEKPRAATQDQLAALWHRRPATEVRTLMHRAYAPEVMHAVSRLDGWRRRHGRVIAAESIFIDAYAGTDAQRGALGDCWLDSGINALSALGRLITLIELSGVIGELPLTATASLSFSEADASGPVTVRTAWMPGRAVKLTTLRFTDGATLRLEHRDCAVTLTGPDGTTLEHDHFGSDLGPARYRRMFASYLANDSNAPPPALDRHLHELLITAHARLL